MKLIYEKSKKGRKGIHLPPAQSGARMLDPRFLRPQNAELPEVSELDVVRHFSSLSRLNFSVDTHFYPLGSCTMKYNPKINEKLAGLPGFASLHPLLPQVIGPEYASGALKLLYETERLLCEITGMRQFTLQPLAGAHGEFTGVMLIAAYHKKNGQERKYILVPDSSHGTNPASAALAGYEVMVVPTGKDGLMDMDEYARMLNDKTAAVMLTCPDTLGIFNPRIKEISELAHKAGALMYYDGANLNALMGKCRPGDMGFDVMHVNLHKTFSTPHGGGGPGSGPVGVNEKLADFLPVPRVEKKSEFEFFLVFDKPDSIGQVAPFYGNFGVLLKAYAYIRALGREGLQRASEMAVLNANYCLAVLKKYYPPALDRLCMHECVFSASELAAKHGIHALDVAKYLIQKGYHPPTIYFPLIVKEALMIEPTETESKETLDEFLEVMIQISRLAAADPESLKRAPDNTPVGRPDETKAARELDLCWKGLQEAS